MLELLGMEKKSALTEALKAIKAVSKTCPGAKESPLHEHGHDYVNIIVHAYRADGSRARGGSEF